ncbi:MAG: hypothetical protein ACI31Q_00805, partial [Erysipelotrichaceae bacterium]
MKRKKEITYKINPKYHQVPFTTNLTILTNTYGLVMILILFFCKVKIKEETSLLLLANQSFWGSRILGTILWS